MTRRLGILATLTLAAAALPCQAVTEDAILEASDGTGVNNGFGECADFDGSLLAIGAPNAEIDGNASQGAVYLFEESGGVWSEIDKLTAPDGLEFDQFGSAVALSGDTLIVGAAGADETSIAEGVAYIFQRDFGGTDNWGMVKRLVASTFVDVFADCGAAVAIDQDTAVMGCRAAYSQARGAVFVYERDEGGTDNWGVTQDLGNDVFDQNASFGVDVDIDGDVLVVGLENQDVVHGSFENEGAVSVFNRAAGVWSQSVKLFASDADSNARLGESVAIDGSTIVAGSRFHDVDGNFSVGHAYVFEKTGPGDADWSETAILEPPVTAFSYFGNTVAIVGERILVGATGDNGGKGYRYEHDGNGWVETGEYTGSDVTVADSFGTGGATGNGWTVVGSPFTDEGSAYIYAEAIVSSGPGRLPESSLLLDKTAIVGELRLDWGATCTGAAVDYAIFEGTLGNWYDHTQVDCSDDGADRSETLVSAAGDRYYLVVPHAAGEEGSYGLDGAGLERPVGAVSCEPVQVIEVCP